MKRGEKTVVTLATSESNVRSIPPLADELAVRKWAYSSSSRGGGGGDLPVVCGRVSPPAPLTTRPCLPLSLHCPRGPYLAYWLDHVRLGVGMAVAVRVPARARLRPVHGGAGARRPAPSGQST